jgi:LuxR family maltose regulon positive regulatory protein
MFRYGEQQTLGRWLKALPAELIQTRPLLSLALAAVCTYYLRSADAEKALNECCCKLEDGTPEAGDLQGKLLVTRGWIARELGEKERAAELSRQGLELLATESHPYRSPALLNLGALYEERGDLAAAAEAYAAAIAGCRKVDDPIFLVWASYGFGQLRESQGARQEAERLYRAALAYARERRFLHASPAGLIFAGLGRLSYETNDLPAATASLEEGLGRSRSAFVDPDPVHDFPASFELLRIKTALADSEGAEALFEQLAARAEATRVPYFEPVLAVLRVRRVGAPEGVSAAWLTGFEARTQGDQLPSVPIADFRHPDIRSLEIITWAQLRLAQGQTARVAGRLERFLTAMVRQGRHGSALALRVLLASLHWQAGRRERAVAVLEPALILGAREGYVRVFLEGGMALAPVLRQARAQGIAPTWGEKLLAALNEGRLVAGAPPGIVSAALNEPLSDRELEVLRLLANGLSNAAIAAELFLSLGTVKRHVHNIYGKLGATSRRGAVARALALGLV